jgi:Domain of unknown function (DUF5668)/B-box zinc finger
MNCANHPDAPVSAYCRTCGKPLCTECRLESNGTVFCSEHAVAAAEPAPGPSAAGSSPYAGSPYAGSSAGTSGGSSHTPPPPNSSPYTSPYTSPYGAAPPSAPFSAGARGVSPGLAFFLGFIPGVGAIYNGQYAKGLVHAVVFGLFISLLSSGRVPGRIPVGPIVLIGLGVLFLMDTLHLLAFDEIIRYWPVGLIIGGAYMLYVRMDSRNPQSSDERGAK